MSLDYYVWGGPRLGIDEIQERLRLVDEGLDDASLFSASEMLVRWRTEVLKKYPALEDLTDDEPSTPWAMTPVESARLIEINIRWEAPEATVLDIVGSALRWRLYVYDPQGPTVVVPGPARWQIFLRRLGLGRLAGPDS